MSGKIVITVMGSDRVGIVAGVTKELEEMRLNILDIRQTIFEGGIFTMIMLVESENDELSMSAVKGRLDEAGERLKVKIYAQHEDIFRYMHRI